MGIMSITDISGITAQITCENLSAGYAGRALFSDLSFSVHKGDYLCIIGENGAGKTTFMKTLLGLQPPVKGKISLGDGLRAEDVGYLSQQTPAQRDFPASVEEIVLSGCQSRRGLRPFYNKSEKLLAKANMERLGILPLAGRCYRELSGGQQQRALLARALCAARKALLLDEPVSGLDPKAASEMYRLIAELNQRDKLTILMISHDISGALPCASHVLHISSPCFWGTKSEYLQNRANSRFSAFTGGELR